MRSDGGAVLRSGHRMRLDESGKPVMRMREQLSMAVLGNRWLRSRRVRAQRYALLRAGHRLRLK